MKNPDYERIKVQIDHLEEKIDNLEVWEYQDEVYELEEKVNLLLQECFEKEFDYINKLAKRIARIKKANDFYDPEAELDRMFPNRYDDDFDEDSMSYDSFFGGD